jgi:hypothetical protein
MNFIKLNALVLSLVFIVNYNKCSFAEENNIKVNRPKEDLNKKPEIKDLEVIGFLVKGKSKSSLPDKVEVNDWFVKTKTGSLVLVPIKNRDNDLYLQQFEGKEVIVKGKGTTITEKNEKGEDVEITKFTTFISIELKHIPIEIAEKPIEEKKVETK